MTQKPVAITDLQDNKEQTYVKSTPKLLLSTEAFVAGWISGAAGIIVGHPFDTIKTLQQTQTKSANSLKGSLVFKSVLTGYGLKGLYRGLFYPLVTYGAVNASFFAGAEQCRNFICAQGPSDGIRKLTYSQVFLAGCAGGFAQLIVVCPSELIKIKLQDQINTGKRLYNGSWDCTKKLWRQHGILGFYKGFSSCILRDIHAWGIYLVVFEYLRDEFMAKGHHYITAELMAGGVAGAVSWVSANPMDVVKSRIQASEKKEKTITAIRSLYKEGGLKAFTRGMFVSFIRGFPSNAVTLFGFAELMRWFNHSNKLYNKNYS